MFFAPSFFKYFFVSIFDERHKSNLLKIDFANEEKTFHRLNDFFVTLPLRRNIGVLLSYKLLIVIGQISESIKKAFEGFQ